MHPYLVRLGVRAEVQEFLAPYYRSDEDGNLCFDYGNAFEHYGLGFHRVPVASGFWLAGNLRFAQVSKVIVCSSAMEAIAWLNGNWHRVGDTFSLLFFSAGATLSGELTAWLRLHFSEKAVVMVLGNDVLGRLSTVKLAAALRGQSLHIVYLAEEKIQILFRGQAFLFSREILSLNALEKSAGFRFRVLISTPKNYGSFFEQLKAAAGLAF